MLSAEDACESDPCQHGGTCVTHNDTGDFRCVCATGYAGEQCETDSCGGQWCANGGTCVYTTNSTPICLCTAVFTGLKCEVPTDSCASTPCLNGSACLNSVTGYLCACLPDSSGHDCSNIYGKSTALRSRCNSNHGDHCKRI